MASQAVKAAKAIYAQPAFVPKGPINSGRFNLIREIAIGTVLGISFGFMWKVRYQNHVTMEAGHCSGPDGGVWSPYECSSCVP
jgi:hypothetical protein